MKIAILSRLRVPASLLAVADLFVLPSLYEGLPLAILEAMAAGVPVVATDAGGTAEVVRDGETGVIVRAADAPALATAIGSMLSNRNRATRLAAAARALVTREYSVDGMVASVAGRYEELLAR